MSAKSSFGISKTGKPKLIAVVSLLVVFFYHFFLVVVPSVNTLFNSFTNWNGLGTKDFLGLGNYTELFSDPNFWNSMTNNVKWMILFLSFPILLGLFIGYLLSNTKKGKLLFRLFYFLPYVVSAAIAGKIFAAFYNPFFGVNLIFQRLGFGDLAINWLSPKYALYSVAAVDMWHWWGFLLVLIMGALQQIDPCLYESAQVEGAGELQKIWHIMIPGIRSTLVFIVLITMVWSISTFEYVWVMTKGGPGSEILSTMLYKNALFKYRAGYACAISVFQGFLAFVIFSVFGLLRKRMED